MLTKENIAGLADLVDKAKEWKNPFLEMVDGPVAKAGIKGADSFLTTVIPVEFHQDINDAVAEALKKDHFEAIMQIWELGGEILKKYVKPLLVKEPGEPV
jgi:hypothetical protein